MNCCGEEFIVWFKKEVGAIVIKGQLLRHRVWCFGLPNTPVPTNQREFNCCCRCLCITMASCSTAFLGKESKIQSGH